MKEFFDRLSVDRSNWRDVFSACLGKMMCVQNACGELVVQNENWNIDLGRGVIFFGMREYPIQFIGSESKSSGTWLWGWENINDFPEKIIRLARETREFGAGQQIEALTTDEFNLNDTYNGHNLSIVTCGLAHSSSACRMCRMRSLIPLIFRALFRRYRSASSSLMWITASWSRDSCGGIRRRTSGTGHASRHTSRRISSSPLRMWTAHSASPRCEVFDSDQKSP